MKIVDLFRHESGASDLDAIILFPTYDKKLGNEFSKHVGDYLSLIIPGKKKAYNKGIVIAMDKRIGSFINDERLTFKIVNTETMINLIELYKHFPQLYNYIIISWEYPENRMTKRLFENGFISAEEFVKNGIMHIV